jgi:hypothetical protein
LEARKKGEMEGIDTFLAHILFVLRKALRFLRCDFKLIVRWNVMFSPWIKVKTEMSKSHLGEDCFS